MNNIYVDELPKSCDECKLGYFFDTQYCFIRPDLLREGVELEKEKHCPLKPLTERLAEERKRVLWEIRKRAKRTQIYIKPTEKSPTGKEKCFVYEVSDDFLDQIERGE